MKDGEFDNIPSNRMRSLADRYRQIRREMADLAAEAEEIRTKVVKRLGLGRYDSVTVYEVGETEVSGYTRGAYRAMRARTRNGHG